MKISRGLLPLSVLTLGTIALTGQSSSLFSASPLLDVGVSGSPSALIAADVNGDARPDLILGTCDGGRCTGVSVLLGRGDGTFAAPAAYGAGGDGANAIAVADVNRDGAQDLLVANANSNTIGILLGNGAGAFQPAIQLSALTAGSSRPMAIAAGDLDGDGIADLVVANERMEHDLAMPIGVWVGLGDGTFASPRDYASAGGSPRSIRIADINRDRLPDLVVLNAASLDEPDRGSVGIFLGKGGGFFSPAAAYATTLRLPHSASIADLNDDGSPDIVVSHSETRDVDVLLGRSDGSLSNARRIGSGAGSGTVNRSNPLALADVNGDSHVDALLGTCFGGGCAGELQVLPGDGRGGFHAAVNEPAGAFGVGLIAVAELNGDGRAHPVVATCSDSQCGRAAIQVLLLQQSSDTPQITAAAGSLDTQRLESSSVSATNISEEGTGVPAVSIPGGATYNIRLVSDASPDVTDLAGLIHSTTSRWTSVREKVWALFYWTHVLKRQTAPIVRHGFEITDPVRNFLDYGYTMCSTISGINQTLYESLGLPHQYWDVCNHTVSTVYYDGKFRMVDSSMSHLVTSDGMNLASLQEAAANSARLVQTQSLYSTSPFGFLTGSDTMRNLSDFTNPSGGVVQGFSRAFCESGLKHRDYYHNWNNGHRHVLNLREDETYTRYYRRLGSANAYWISSESVSSPDPNKTFEIDAENRFGLRGNGQWIFTPKLSPDRYAQAVYQATNIAAVPEGGLTALTTGQDAHVVYKVQAANAIASQVVHARFRISDATAAAAIAVSVNHGATWISVGSVGSTTGESVPVDIALRDQVNGAYETLVRIEMRDGGSPSSIVLTGLTIETITQVNAKALPKLNVGRNEIYLGAGDQSDTLVLWPDLRGALWQRDVYASANIATQDVSVPRKYTAVAYPSSLLTDAHLTYRMEAPTDITRLVYGGRLHNFKAGSYIDFLHSFDGGATWIHSYRLTDVAAPYDDIHYETVTNIPAGVRSVLFKFLIHNTSTDVTRASGLYSVRMEVNHQPKTSVLRPLDVTWRWKEVRPDRTLLERSHRQRVSAFPFTYVVNVGGSDHPVMESVTVNVENDADTSPFGYSDGIDAGGQKYAYTRRTDGTNVAKDRPYTVSRTPSGFQSSAAASNTTILTDGVVGAPASGAISYWWGQCWSSGTLVELQVDLGAERSVSAFRAHLLGYPWWDALKGQVKDQVEILTSLDGINFSSQGVLQTSLWKKDLPINHMLLDDEKATAWNFERLVPAPVTTRYVKYRVTPKRDLCVSELQVIDQVLDEPFDIQIALPASGETTGSPANVAPAVALTRPAADTNFVPPATIDLEASASDSDGTISRVDFFAGATLVGTATASPYTVTWADVPDGTYLLTARATDNAGASTTSAGVTITVQTSPPPAPGVLDEIVVHAAPSAQIGGGWSIVPDSTAASGARLQNPNTGQPKLSTALANPAESFEASFEADAGKGYRIWVRGKALNDDYTNDSVFLQFDRSVDATGTPIWRIGTTTATSVILEECGGCGLKGWGWTDNGYGTDGPLVYFAESGPQRLRIQMREDGLGIDQVVLSAVQYKTTAPGATKNDTTILPATSAAPPPPNAAPAVALTARPRT